MSAEKMNNSFNRNVSVNWCRFKPSGVANMCGRVDKGQSGDIPLIGANEGYLTCFSFNSDRGVTEESKIVLNKSDSGTSYNEKITFSYNTTKFEWTINAGSDKSDPGSRQVTVNVEIGPK